MSAETWTNNGGRIEGKGAGTSEAEVIAVVGEVNNQRPIDTERARLIVRAPQIPELERQRNELADALEVLMACFYGPAFECGSITLKRLDAARAALRNAGRLP